MVREGAKVRIIDNFSTGKREKLIGVEKDIEIFQGDIRNALACRKACQGIEVIFHLAAYISVPGSIADPITSDAINIGGALNLLLAARDAGVDRFVLSSSSAVYGDTPILPTPETALPLPRSPYGIEKLYAEHMCRLFHNLYGIKTVALRYFNVYGPGQNPESEYAAVIPKFITRMLSDQPTTIFGDGEQTRDFLYVEDVVQANKLAAAVTDAGGETFNIAGGKPTTLNNLAGLLKEMTGYRLEISHTSERPGDIRHSSADIFKAVTKLGFSPTYSLASGLEKTVLSFRSAG
jgi:UDP-glucose 4-epimerase